MFSAVAFTIVGAIFLAVLLLLGLTMQTGGPQDTNASGATRNDARNMPAVGGKATAYRSSSYDNRSVQSAEYPAEYARETVPPPVMPPHREQQHAPDHDGRHQTGHSNAHVHRAVTPVPNNHYRPSTPSFYRPPTPGNGVGPQRGGPSTIQPTTSPADARPQTPVTPPQQRAVTPIQDVSEPDRSFRTFNELSDTEKEGLIDVSNCSIFVKNSTLTPLLESIRRGGDGNDGGTVGFLVAYFDKKNDKDLSPSDKVVRKSLKIKHKRLAHAARFARLKVSHKDDAFYHLYFHDYTPYVEEHAPRYDTVRHETTAKERSRWEQVEAAVHQNTGLTNIHQMSILVPGKKE